MVLFLLLFMLIANMHVSCFAMPPSKTTTARKAPKAPTNAQDQNTRAPQPQADPTPEEIGATAHLLYFRRGR